MRITTIIMALIIATLGACSSQEIEAAESYAQFHEPKMEKVEKAKKVLFYACIEAESEMIEGYRMAGQNPVPNNNDEIFSKVVGEWMKSRSFLTENYMSFTEGWEIYYIHTQGEAAKLRNTIPKLQEHGASEESIVRIQDALDGLIEATVQALEA